MSSVDILHSFLLQSGVTGVKDGKDVTEIINNNFDAMDDDIMRSIVQHALSTRQSRLRKKVQSSIIFHTFRYH